jgi:S-adenosyl methyltransferase
MTTPLPKDDPHINPNIPHVARVYDYLLGGVANFLVDREAAAVHAAAFGGLRAARASVRANRDFLIRAVSRLTNDGIRQFLDVGTGIPNADNVHSVAQAHAPDSRIVCVDSDPTVLAHAHQLMDSTPEGAATFIQGDLRDPWGILQEVPFTLDVSKPIAIMLVAILHLLDDDEHPYRIVQKLVDAVPSGSFLVISHMASDIEPERIARLAGSVRSDAPYGFFPRSHDEVSRFFAGLVLESPGVVPVQLWHPTPRTPDEITHHYGAIARKP